MADTTTRLRAELVLDVDRATAATNQLRQGMDALGAETLETVGATSRLERELASLEKQAAQIRQIEIDLLADRPGSGMSKAVITGQRDLTTFNNQMARQDIDRIGGLLDPVLDELDLMDAAFGAVQKSDREAERQAKKAEAAAKRSKGVWGDFSASLKKGAKDALQPLTDMGSAVLEVGKGLGVIGGVAYGVVSAIDAISSAFSRSQETIDAYGAALDGLPGRLQDIQDSSRDFWTKRLGLDKLPGFKAREESRQVIEGIIGTPDTPMAPGKEGKFDQLARDRAAIEGFILMQQTKARDAGFEVDDRGGISPTRRADPTGGLDMGRRMLPDRVARDMLMQNRYTTSDGKQTLDYQGAQREYARILEAEKGLGATLAQALQDMTVRPAQEIAENAKMLDSKVKELIPRLDNMFSPEALISIVKDNQRKEKAAKDWAYYLRHGRFPIDARGAKITVNTQVKTDDPARFADVALKSAFIGVAARPLSATMGLGAPMVGGARRP